MFSKALLKQFGAIRAATIKETISAGMLWAEAELGLGQGNEKWTKAWTIIKELLHDQGISLKDKEIPYVTTLMKSNIPEINSITYSSQPEEVLLAREIRKRTPEMQALINKLKKKYPVGKE
jgi:hypothetical protein